MTLGPPLDYPESKKSGVVISRPTVMVNYLTGGEFRIELGGPRNVELYGVRMEGHDQKTMKYSRSVYKNGKHHIAMDMP